MEAKRRVISNKNFPARLPITFTVVVWLFLDRLQVSDVTWGVVITILAIYWIGNIYLLFKEEHVDLFEIKGSKSNPEK